MSANPLAVFMDSMGQSVQVAQALRSAAEQQSQHEDEMRLRNADLDLRQREFGNTQGQQSFKDQMDAFNAGGQPVSDSGTVAKNTDVPRYQADQGGALTRTGSGTNETADPGRTVSAGGRQMYIPTQQENQDADLRGKVRETSAVNDANAFSLPDALSHAWEQRMGLEPGTLKGMQVPKGAVPNLLTQLAKPEAQDKPSKATAHFTSDDKGNVHAFSFDPDAEPGKRVTHEATFPLAGKGIAPSGRGDGGESENSKAVTRRETLKQIQSLADEEADLHKTRLRLGGALKTADPNTGIGQLYVDEKGKTIPLRQAAKGNPATEKALMDEMHQRLDAATSRVKNVIDQKNGLYQSIGAQPKVSTETAQRAVDQAGAKKPDEQPKGTAPKTASLDQVRAYAAKNQLPEAEAIRRVKAEGYQIGQ